MFKVSVLTKYFIYIWQMRSDSTALPLRKFRRHLFAAVCCQRISAGILDFSPFEKAFSHIVHEPLKFLELLQLWRFSEFNWYLFKACKSALENLEKAQSRLKLRHDETLRHVDKLLTLLYFSGKPFQARYHGPYNIDKKWISDVNHIIITHGRRKQKQHYLSSY